MYFIVKTSNFYVGFLAAKYNPVKTSKKRTSGNSYEILRDKFGNNSRFGLSITLVLHMRVVKTQTMLQTEHEKRNMYFAG